MVLWHGLTEKDGQRRGGGCGGGVGVAVARWWLGVVVARHGEAMVVAWWLVSWWHSGAWLQRCSMQRRVVRQALEEEEGVRWRWGMEGEEWRLRVLIAVQAWVGGAPVILVVHVGAGTHNAHPMGDDMDVEARGWDSWCWWHQGSHRGMSEE